jgi:hypothetical protein
VPPSLAKKISDLAQEHSKIYILGQLNAASLGEVLQSAHLIIVKCGGLSLMELASFKFDHQSVICLHEEATASENAGLVWEEGNKQWFFKHCQKVGQKILLANPTNIQSAYQQITHSF